MFGSHWGSCTSFQTPLRVAPNPKEKLGLTIVDMQPSLPGIPEISNRKTAGRAADEPSKADTIILCSHCPLFSNYGVQCTSQPLPLQCLSWKTVYESSDSWLLLHLNPSSILLCLPTYSCHYQPPLNTKLLSYQGCVKCIVVETGSHTHTPEKMPL